MRTAAIALALSLIVAPGFAQTAAPAPAAPTSAAPAAPAVVTPAPAPVKPKLVRKARFAKRFDAANVTHDGKLTLEQATSAKMTGVVKNFDAIDADKKGYITKPDITAYRRTSAGRAERL